MAKVTTVNFVETPRAASAPADERTLMERMKDRAVIAWQHIDQNKRLIISWLTSMLAAYFVGKVVGTIVMSLTILAAQVTGSLFIVSVIYLLGLVLAIYAGCVIGRKVGMYTLEGDINADLKKAKDKVTGWFKSRPLAAA